MLGDILAQLPVVMAQVSQRRIEQGRALMVQTFTKSATIINQYRHAADQLRVWQTAVLETLPCVLVDAASQRCEGTPWNATSDLLWVAYRGRRYFPTCQFTSAGPPDPAWPVLVAKASEMANCREWELLAWLLTPHPLLKGGIPIAVIQQDPKRVISLAGLTLKESRR